MPQKTIKNPIRFSKGIIFSTKMVPKFFYANTALRHLGVDNEKTPYYWWFKYLQLNEDYAKFMKGEKTKINESIAIHLGIVEGQEFEDWWLDHIYLFEEPKSKWDVALATTEDDLAPFQRNDVANVVLPLDWSKQELKETLDRLIDSLKIKEKKAVTIGNSKALFKLGRKWSIRALSESYRVLVEKQKANDRFLKTGVKTAWADIGILAKLPYAKGMKLGETGTYTDRDKRITLTILTKRCHDRAKKFLKASVTNSFP